MCKRNTIQRTLVLNAVRELMCHANAEEVYNHIHKNYPTIGLATVYRNLNELSEEGLIKKIVAPGCAERFDHNLDEHHHMICTKCHNAFDVELESTPDLLGKIKDRHGMEITGYQMTFYGVCKECQKI